jgi:hypothetical protein
MTIGGIGSLLAAVPDDDCARTEVSLLEPAALGGLRRNPIVARGLPVLLNVVIGATVALCPTQIRTASLGIDDTT